MPERMTETLEVAVPGPRASQRTVSPWRPADLVEAKFDPLAYAGTFIGVSIARAVAASLPALPAAGIDAIATLRED